jgi:hypothetical protein
MRNFVRVVRDALAQFVASRQHQPPMLHVQVFLFGGFVKRILRLRAAFTGTLMAPRCLVMRGLYDWRGLLWWSSKGDLLLHFSDRSARIRRYKIKANLRSRNEIIF